MGQLIRKTVSNSIKQFVADINRTLELGFSTKALKWRWQAFKTGKSFAEIVFQKTIRYQVNEIFLINQENGLLIEHVGTDDMLKDNNAISAMLSVIQEFIGDSLQSPDDNLQSAEMGENLLFFSHGPKAFLVFVVKGSPTERFKSKAQKLIENVHAEFSDVLINEQNYRNNTDLQNYLREHLVTKSISDTPKKINWAPWIVGILAIILAVGYWSYKRNKEYRDLASIANSIDGLYIQSIERENGKFNIKGLVDPIADTALLQREDVVLMTKPYVSLDGAILEKRAQQLVANYQGVNVKIDNHTLVVSGKVSPENYSELQAKLNSLIGIQQIINHLAIDNSEAISEFVKPYLETNEKVKYEITHNNISLSGLMTFKLYQDFTQKIKELFPSIKIGRNNLTISDSNQLLINKINTTKINMFQLEKNSAEQEKSLHETINTLQKLLQRKVLLKLIIIGQSDCHGTLSDDYSLKRAQTMMKMLIQNSINPKLLSTKVLKCKLFDQPLNDAQKIVSFSILQIQER